MKKKVFSLMMMLLLAVTGFVRADELTVHEGTATNGYVPVYGFYADAYLKSEMVYPASELSALNGAQISSLKFYATQSSVSWGEADFQVFVAEVASEQISAFAGPGTVVYTGALSIADGEMLVNFTTPYTYNGGNLLVGFYNTVKGTYVTSTWQGETVSGASVQGYSYSSLEAISATQRNFLPKTTFTYTGGGGAGGGDQLHVMYMNGDEPVIDALDLGVRPAGAWMAPFNFTMYTDGAAYTVNVLDFTPSDGMFTVSGEELPFEVTRTDDVDLMMTTNGTEAGLIERQFVAITEGDRAAHIWPVTVELYAPEVPDVWEKACTHATTFPFTEIPATAHNTVLHNDYTLPFPEIPEGVDAVYKLVIDHDQMLNAEVTYGDNGKVALYREGFEGEGGPMATNNYTGTEIFGGGGATGGPYEVQIGEGTSTTGYLPMYYLYNYALSTQLYLGTELAEAGATTAPMTSISWYSSSTYGYNIQNVSIWMANVTDTQVGTSSPLGNNMTLVYEGNFQEVVGWNEFVFNAGNFAWDGQSNVLVMTQMNNGSWSSSIQWACGNVGFTAGGYVYQDNTPYSAGTTSYTLSTTTNRANTVFKGGNRNNTRSHVIPTACVNPTANTTVEPARDGWLAYDDGVYATSIGNSTAYDWTWATMYPASMLGNNNTLTKVAIYNTSYNVDDITIDIYQGGTSAPGTLIASKTVTPTEGLQEVTLNSPVTINPSQNLWIVLSEYGTYVLTSCNSVVANNQWVENDGWYNIGDLSASLAGYGWMIRAYVENNGAVPPGPGPDPTPTEVSYSAGPVIENLPVTAGTYYLVASSTDPNFQVTINAEEMPCPTVEEFAFQPQPADNEDEVEPNAVTLRWMIPEYATGWRLVFGSTYYPEQNHPQTIIYPEDGTFTRDMANSFTVRNLWNNTNYFWHVEFNNDGCPDGVSSPIWGFTTHLNVPQNLTAVDETVFNDESITLNWNAVVDRTYRMYNVYRDGELIDHTTVNNIGATSFTDTPQPYNMAGYTYYVTAVYDEGESAPSNTVTVKVSGRGNVNGHVYEQDGTTGIAGATVTMAGPDEFGVNHTYTFTTDAQGYYSGALYAGPSYDGQAAKDGYQTDYVPEQGEPIVVNYNQTASPYDYILDENFDPVCSVIAQYYPDSTDINAPYVKVYWGCGLPGEEIVEDFETGDFSKFDWQLDGSYPWSITTNNPYEGTYCMKSGGAGVASVTSNMTVTVDIPADGDMSFFCKISSESNYDYGHFYIDGVEKYQASGAGNWVEKTYPVTQGSHTFQWRYTKDSSVNSNDDCFYVDYITFYRRPEPAIPGMTYDFEDGTMQGWTSVDADGDGYGWYMGSEIMTGQTGNNGSSDFVLSQSYYLGTVLYPDNYLVSPQVQLGGVVRFYACAQDASYAAEHFGLAVSTTNTNPSSFTTIQEWTMTAKGVSGNAKAVKADVSAETPMMGHSREGNTRAQGNWYEFTVDLSAYSGMGYVAIRHFNCHDMFYLNVDDITIGEPGKGMPNNDRAFAYYRVYRTDCYNDGPYTLLDEDHPDGNTVVLSCELHDTIYIDVSWPDAAPGIYKWGVGCVYIGNRGEEIAGPIHWAQPTDGNAKDNRDVIFSDDFEGGSLDSWTMIDADGDGDTWQIATPAAYGIGDAHSGTYCASSWSWNSYTMYPDNYMISPLVDGATSITYFVATNTAYPDHYAVMASSTGTAISNFTTVFEEDAYRGTASGNGTKSSMTQAGTREMSVWAEKNVQLPAGTKYVAFRHYNSDDMNYLFIDDVTISGESGPTPPTPPTPGTEGLQEARESEIVWSNCLDKDMYLGENDVNINVLLNSADSPEGVTVSFTNLNEAEQELYPVADVVLDETGYYAWDTFRKGNYELTITKEGYETITENVSIWEPTSLRYVMIEIIYAVDNLYVSRTGWAMWEGHGDPYNPTPGPGPGPGGNGDSFSVNFDDGQIPAGWTTIDANNDGYNWVLGSQVGGVYLVSGASLAGTGHNESADLICSGSYSNATGQAITPDNYLVSPQVTLGAGSTFSFWACAQDASYAAEHFGVFISDNGTSDWTSVQEWTMTAKSGGDVMSIGRGGQTRAQGSWHQYTVDLSSYAGQKYIAIRHFNCNDQFILNVDDIELTSGAKSGDRHLEYYKVMCTSIDGVPIFNINTPHNFCQVDTDQLQEGELYLCKVAAVYSTGISPYVECVWEYESCEHYAGTVNGLDVNGTTVTWDYPGGGTGPTPPPGQGDSFSVNFDNGQMPAGWTTIDANNDGYNWVLGSQVGGVYLVSGASLAGTGHNESADLICSGSYSNATGQAITPDNYLVSPQVTLAAGSTFSFWACAQDASYAAEHFGVFISDNGTGNWTGVQEWTMTAKSGGDVMSIGRGGQTRAQGSWHQYTVDLSAYAGQKYIAIRHFNCNDQFILDVDDIELTSGAKGNRAPWDLMFTFQAPEGGHYGVVSDGTNFYTSNWGYSSAAHNFYKYDIQGNMLEGFEISGCGTLRGMTYDGTHFYGVANSSTVYCVDLANHSVVSTFTSAYGAMRGITYDPVRDGFWVIGNWSGNLTLIDRTGAIVQVGPEPTSASDLAYYKDENDVEHVFCFNNGDNGVYDYNITTNTLGGSVFNFSNIPGFASGTSGGCHVADINGKTAFIGDVQQSPNLIGVYELRDAGTPGPINPEPSGDVLGAMVFLNGEWEAFVPAPTNSYEFPSAGEYCVRIVYNGTNELPSNNFFYAMSCEECAGDTPGTCDAGDPIHAEVINATDQVRIWWGVEPAEPISEWLYYDDGEMQGSVGAGGTIYWGIMFPAASLQPYAGTSLTQVAVMEYDSPGSYTANIYLGGTSAPATLVSTQTFSATGTGDWNYVTLGTPVPVDGTQNLWITMYQSGITYPATGGNDTGDANGRWVSVDGNTWYDIIDASSGAIDYTWLVRGFVTNQTKGGQITELPEFKGEVGGELSSVQVTPVAPAFAPMTRANIVSYNVYRADDANGNYVLRGSVVEAGQTLYEFFDTPETAGTYYYQVKAVYDDGCESEPALAADDPTHNYVSAFVDAIGENSDMVALYPNPTKGNVTIEANGMSRITVVSVLGQVVFDTELNANVYTLNMSQFNAGMYMVRIYTENGVTVKRVTVMQ
jgi:hypothetical protein